MKIYIDGCSLTYGQGIPRDKSIGSLFKTVGLHEIVLDSSRPGKSNLAIAFDTWNSRNDFDVFVLGFTYSNRSYLKFRDLNLDFHSVSKFGINYQGHYDSIIEKNCTDLHKQLYTLYDSNFYARQNDIIADTIISKLKTLKKIVVAFSWEKRNTDYNILYPVYGSEFRISKSDHHLNVDGTRHLFNVLQLKLLEQKNV